MDERSKEIIKMALLYMGGNLPAAKEFLLDTSIKGFNVNGVNCNAPNAEEIEAILEEFQDVL